MQKDRPQRGYRQYFARKAAIVFGVLLLCLLIFLTVSQIASAMVVAGEAMTTRAKYALSTEQLEQEDLENYFTLEFIESGKLLEYQNRYRSFSISTFNQSTNVSWVWTWPWSRQASVKVSERVVGISGTASEDEEGETAAIPPWTNGIYSLKMKKVGGAWLIDDIVYMGEDPKHPTPTPTPTPIPSDEPESTEEP